MTRERSDEWVARVVAWHNRHPLARRIAPEQVQAMGWVSLPFSATADARAAASRGRGWRAAFTEKFLPPFSPRRIARWVLRHGQEAAPELAGIPVREILLDRREPDAEAQPVTLWVATASIVDGRAQSRVLLAAEAAQPLLGRRLWSRPRLAASACAVLAAVALPAGLGWVSMPPTQQPGPALALAAEPSASSVFDRSATPMPAPIGAAQDIAPPIALAAPSHPPEPAVAAVAPPAPPPAPMPPDVSPQRGNVSLPQRGFALDEAEKTAARATAAAARAERAAADVLTAKVAYAVAAPRVRSQAESELMRVALQAAVGQAGRPPACRVEALPAGDDWRVVCWPFLHRKDAERLREQLVARGHRLEVIDF